MTGLCRIGCLSTTGVIVLAIAFIEPPSPASAVSYSVPAIAKVVATVPLNPDLHAVCLVRSQPPIGGQVAQRAFCYLTAKPANPPPPPPPPYAAANHRVLTASLDGGTLTVPIQPCSGYPDVFALKVDLVIQLSKTGGQASGTTYLYWDFDAPFDCAVPAETGPLTLTTFPEGWAHNEDSATVDQEHEWPFDLCSDYEELGTNQALGGLRDPFNPYDFYDVFGPSLGPPDGYIDSPNDILQVMLRYSANPSLPYDVRADRGPPVGPYAWNREGPNGTIDAPNDMTAVKFQYQHDCRPAP